MARTGSTNLDAVKTTFLKILNAEGEERAARFARDVELAQLEVLMERQIK